MIFFSNYRLNLEALMGMYHFGGKMPEDLNPGFWMATQSTLLRSDPKTLQMHSVHPLRVHGSFYSTVEAFCVLNPDNGGGQWSIEVA